MRSRYKNLFIAIFAGLVLSILLTRSSLAFIDLASQYLSETKFDSTIFITASFLVSFLLSVVAGWFSSPSSLINPLTGYLTYVLLESFFRMARLHKVPVFESLVTVWRVADLYLTLIAVFAGIFLGYFIGAKAKKEEHYVRLYVFSAFLVLILSSALMVHGIEALNPFSNTRGVL